MEDECSMTLHLGKPKDFQPRKYNEHPELCTYAEHPEIGSEAVYFFNFSTFSQQRHESQHQYSWHTQFIDMVKKNIDLVNKKLYVIAAATNTFRSIRMIAVGNTHTITQMGRWNTFTKRRGMPSFIFNSISLLCFNLI